MTEIERRCPSCSSRLVAARIVERGPHSVAYDLEYRLSEPSVAALGGAVRAKGSVSAFLCGECGHIALFASPVIDAILAREGPEPCLSCGTPIPVDADRCAACGWSWLDETAESSP